MSTILKNIIQFTGLVVGVPTVIAHGLNVNGIAVTPDLVLPTSVGGYTIIGTSTQLSVTRQAGAADAVNVYVEYWHTIERALPQPNQLSGLTPFIVGSGSNTGSGTLNQVAKWTSTTTLGNSSIQDDGSQITTASKLQIGATAPSATQRILLSGQTPTTTTILVVRGDDANHTAVEALGVWVLQLGTFDTTAAPASSRGVEIAISSTKALGANALINYGIISNVAGGDQNFSFFSTSGTLRNDGPASLADVDVTRITTDLTAIQSIRGADTSHITFTGVNSPISTAGAISGATLVSSGNVRVGGSTLWFTESATTNLFIYANSAGASGNQNIDIMAGGTGVVRVNANTDGTTNTGTGGFEVWAGGNSTTKWLDVGSAGLAHANINLGFYGTSPIAKQTGVAVTAGAIHAALVNLGLISA